MSSVSYNLSNWYELCGYSRIIYINFAIVIVQYDKKKSFCRIQGKNGGS